MAAATAGTKAKRPTGKTAEPAGRDGSRSGRDSRRDSRPAGAQATRGGQATRTKARANAPAPASKRSRGAPTRPRAARSGRQQERATTARPSAAVLGGIVWAALLVIGVGLGAPTVALVLVPVGLVAVGAGVRSLRRVKSRGGPLSRATPAAVGLLLALVVPFAALAGEAEAVAGMVLAAGISLVVATPSAAVSRARPVRAIGPLAFAMAAPAVAATSLVLARLQDPTDALVLVIALLAYDVSAFVMGNGKSAVGGPMAVASGVFAIAVVATAVAATMDPPFSGVRPWVVFALLAVAAPMGVRLGDMVFGPTTRLPAFLRLDSLILAGPVWVVAGAAVLHR